MLSGPTLKQFNTFLKVRLVMDEAWKKSEEELINLLNIRYSRF